MKKTLKIEAITNELKGSSLFFSRPSNPSVPPSLSEEPHPQETTAEPAAIIPHTSQDGPKTRALRADSTPRTSRTGRTTPRKRTMKRHAFEIYFDQYESLVRLASEDRMAGGMGSMSRMVREALDRFIANHGQGSE